MPDNDRLNELIQKLMQTMAGYYGREYKGPDQAQDISYWYYPLVQWLTEEQRRDWAELSASARSTQEIVVKTPKELDDILQELQELRYATKGKPSVRGKIVHELPYEKLQKLAQTQWELPEILWPNEGSAFVLSGGVLKLQSPSRVYGDVTARIVGFQEPGRILTELGGKHVPGRVIWLEDVLKQSKRGLVVDAERLKPIIEITAGEERRLLYPYPAVELPAPSIPQLSESEIREGVLTNLQFRLRRLGGLIRAGNLAAVYGPDIVRKELEYAFAKPLYQLTEQLKDAVAAIDVETFRGNVFQIGYAIVGPQEQVAGAKFFPLPSSLRHLVLGAQGYQEALEEAAKITEWEPIKTAQAIAEIEKQFQQYNVSRIVGYNITYDITKLQKVVAQAKQVAGEAGDDELVRLIESFESRLGRAQDIMGDVYQYVPHLRAVMQRPTGFSLEDVAQFLALDPTISDEVFRDKFHSADFDAMMTAILHLKLEEAKRRLPSQMTPIETWLEEIKPRLQKIPIDRRKVIIQPGFGDVEIRYPMSYQELGEALMEGQAYIGDPLARALELPAMGTLPLAGTPLSYITWQRVGETAQYMVGRVFRGQTLPLTSLRLPQQLVRPVAKEIAIAYQNRVIALKTASLFTKIMNRLGVTPERFPIINRELKALLTELPLAGAQAETPLAKGAGLSVLDLNALAAYAIMNAQNLGATEAISLLPHLTHKDPISAFQKDFVESLSKLNMLTIMETKLHGSIPEDFEIPYDIAKSYKSRLVMRRLRKLTPEEVAGWNLQWLLPASPNVYSGEEVVTRYIQKVNEALLETFEHIESPQLRAQLLRTVAEFMESQTKESPVESIFQLISQEGESAVQKLLRRIRNPELRHAAETFFGTLWMINESGIDESMVSRGMPRSELPSASALFPGANITQEEFERLIETIFGPAPSGADYLGPAERLVDIEFLTDVRQTRFTPEELARVAGAFEPTEIPLVKGAADAHEARKLFGTYVRLAERFYVAEMALRGREESYALEVAINKAKRYTRRYAQEIMRIETPLKTLDESLKAYIRTDVSMVIEDILRRQAAQAGVQNPDIRWSIEQLMEPDVLEEIRARVPYLRDVRSTLAAWLSTRTDWSTESFEDIALRNILQSSRELSERELAELMEKIPDTAIRAPREIFKRLSPKRLAGAAAFLEVATTPSYWKDIIMRAYRQFGGRSRTYSWVQGQIKMRPAILEKVIDEVIERFTKDEQLVHRFFYGLRLGKRGSQLLYDVSQYIAKTLFYEELTSPVESRGSEKRIGLPRHLRDRLNKILKKTAMPPPSDIEEVPIKRSDRKRIAALMRKRFYELVKQLRERRAKELEAFGLKTIEDRIAESLRSFAGNVPVDWLQTTGSRGLLRINPELSLEEAYRRLMALTFLAGEMPVEYLGPNQETLVGKLTVEYAGEVPFLALKTQTGAIRPITIRGNAVTFPMSESKLLRLISTAGRVPPSETLVRAAGLENLSNLLPDTQKIATELMEVLTRAAAMNASVVHDVIDILQDKAISNAPLSQLFDIIEKWSKQPGLPRAVARVLDLIYMRIEQAPPYMRNAIWKELRDILKTINLSMMNLMEQPAVTAGKAPLASADKAVDFIINDIVRRVMPPVQGITEEGGATKSIKEILQKITEAGEQTGAGDTASKALVKTEELIQALKKIEQRADEIVTGAKTTVKEVAQRATKEIAEQATQAAKEAESVFKKISDAVVEQTAPSAQELIEQASQGAKPKWLAKATEWFIKYKKPIAITGGIIAGLAIIGGIQMARAKTQIAEKLSDVLQMPPAGSTNAAIPTTYPEMAVAGSINALPTPEAGMGYASNFPSGADMTVRYDEVLFNEYQMNALYTRYKNKGLIS